MSDNAPKIGLVDIFNPNPRFNPMYLNENWRECTRSDRYIVTENGDVYSLNMVHPTKFGKKKAQSLSQDGYPRVKIKREWVSVHRLVAEAFFPGYDKTHQVNHKDSNKLNNHISNLEWLSQVDNLKHAMANGNHPRPMRAIVGTNIETGEIIRFESQAEAVRHGFTQANISKCIRGERPHSHGYKWEYENENRPS